MASVHPFPHLTLLSVVSYQRNVGRMSLIIWYPTFQSDLSYICTLSKGTVILWITVFFKPRVLHPDQQSVDNFLHITAVCIMIDRLQKWVKCNFPSPLIGIHGQSHWRLGVSGFIWFESTGKVRPPKCGNCSVPCTFTLLHYGIWYCSLKDNIRSVKNNLWGTLQGLTVVYSIDTVINLLYSLVYWTWLFR